MGYQDQCLLSQEASNAEREEFLGNVRIHCTQRVVEEVDVSIAIARSGQGDPGLLSSWDVDSSFSDLSVESAGELSEILFQLTHSHHLSESPPKWSKKRDLKQAASPLKTQGVLPA